MNETSPKIWVGGICIKDSKVLLIHRINKERLFHQEYFLFPGKTVDEDESIEVALLEEFKDIAIIVNLGELLHSRDESGDEAEYYYLCEHVLGEPVMPQLPDADAKDQKQFFTPMWVSLSELEDLMVYPESVKRHLIDEINGRGE